MRQSTRQRARINIKALVILVVVTALLGVGALVGHRVRNKVIASRALEKGKAALAKEDWQAAANHLLDYLLRFPEDAAMLRAYARARLAIRPLSQGNVAAAIDSYRRLLRLTPGDEEACHALGRLYFELRNFTESAYICRQRLKTDPEDTVSMMWLGRALGAQRKYDDARVTLERLVTLRPEEVRAYALLSGIAMAVGGRAGLEEGRAWLDQAVDANPKSAEAWTRRGKFRRENLDDIDGDREDMETAAGLPVSDPRVLLLMAGEWMSLNELERCRHALKTVDTFDEKALWDLDINVASFTLAKLTSMGKLALLQKNGDAGVRLADRALHELTQAYHLLYLPLAIDLYIAGGVVDKARSSLTEYSDAIRRQQGTKGVDPKLVLADAVVAQAEGKPYAVISILADLVIVNPNLPRAWRLLWKAYQETGQQRRSWNALESYVRLRPDDVAANLILAEAYRNRDWAKVVQFADKVMLRSPKNIEAKLLIIEARLHNARGSLSKKKLADLRRQLDDIGQADPGNVNVRLVGAFAAFLEGDADDAAQQLERAIRDSDDPLTAAMQLAEFHAQRGELDEAIEVCREATQRHPDTATPWLGLAELHIAAENPDKARTMLEEAVKRLSGEERDRARYALVQYLITHGDRSGAIDILTELATTRPRDIRPRVALLAMNEIADNAEMAKRLLAELKEIEGKNGVHWRLEQSRLWLRGDAWKDKQSAIEEMLTYCYRVDPGWPAPALLLGMMQERLGHIIAAEQTYRTALRLFPDAVDVVSRLLTLLERGGRFAEAQAILDRLPEKLTALSGHRVRVAMGQGEFDSAIDELKRRVASDPNDAPSRVTLARLLYQHQGEIDRSIALLDEASALTPDELSVVSSKAAVLHYAGRDDEAHALLNRAVEHRKDFSAYRLRADFLETVNKLDAAEQDYQHLTTLGAETASGAYAALGAFYDRHGRHDEALIAWDAGLKVAPGDPPLEQLMTRALLSDPSADRRARGQDMLNKLVQQSPDDVGTLLLQSDTLMRDGSPGAFKKAELVLERVVTLEPRNVPAHLRLIMIARNLGDIDKTNERITNAIALNPNNTELTLAQAGFEADRNNPRIARELVQSVIRSDPNNVKARNLLSRLAMQYGSPEAAIAVNAEALKLDPSNETAQLVRAKLLKMQDKRGEAIVHLAAYCETTTGRQSIKAMLALTQLHREKGEFAEAERRLKEAEQLSPNDPLVHLENLRLLAAQQRYAEILSYLADHRSGTAVDTSVLVTGAWILAASSQDHYRNEAKQLFEQVISAAPNRLDAHLGLAQLLYRMGQINAAVRAYQHLLDIAPFDGNALNDLAWILAVEQGKQDEAVELADRGTARFPNDPHLLDTRGVVLTKVGRLDEAQSDLERSVRLAGKLPATKAAALLHLAEVLARQGKIADARARLDEALTIDKTSPALAKAQVDAVLTLIGQR